MDKKFKDALLCRVDLLKKVIKQADTLKDLRSYLKIHTGALLDGLEKRIFYVGDLVSPDIDYPRILKNKTYKVISVGIDGWIELRSDDGSTRFWNPDRFNTAE